MYKKIGIGLLCLVLAVATLPLGAPTCAAAEEATPAPRAALPSIEEQVHAYAKSIDQVGADDAAAWALATHGITGGGKILNVGASHSLTAMIVNSNMTLSALTNGCEMGIRMMQQVPTLPSVFVDGGSRWSDTAMFYTNNAYTDDTITANGRLCSSGTLTCTTRPNAYDASMIWIAGTMGIHQYYTKGAVTRDTITYHVTVQFNDRFDFSTGNASVSKELASIFGSALFREFDWQATVSFSVVVPNTCDHQSANYHFTFDAAQEHVSTDATAPFAPNTVTRVDWYPSNNSNRRPYYELDKTAVLYHDLPWVMEYTLFDPYQATLCATPNHASSLMGLMHTKNIRLVFTETITTAQGKQQTRWMGIPLDLPNPDIYTYTVRLENRINSDGSNMVYASVYNETRQTVAIDPTPMDNLYIVEKGIVKETYPNRNDLSGKDFMLACIGSRQYLFDPQTFDLRIWENGIDGGTGNYFDNSAASAPTCTADGGVTHTCRLCGYTEFDKTTDKLGHEWSDWVQSKAATCSVTGEERRTCARCKGSETRALATLPHNLTSHEGQAPTCAVEGWQPYESCADCAHTTYTAIPTVPHTYEAVITPPTCIAQGYTTHTCVACGDSYTDSYISRGQHSYTFTVVPPTCGAAGEMVSLCAHCGDRIVTPYGSATGRHTYDDDRDPDCNKCGDIREVVTILMGDADGNGKINNRDLGLLQQWLSGYEVTVDTAACDLDHNGKVNNRDLGILQQQLSGF